MKNNCSGIPSSFIHMHMQLYFFNEVEVSAPAVPAGLASPSFVVIYSVDLVSIPS